MKNTILRLGVFFIILLGCSEEPEAESIVIDKPEENIESYGPRISFSEKNSIPENLMVLTPFDQSTLDIGAELNSTEQNEIILNNQDKPIFINLIKDDIISSETTVRSLLSLFPEYANAKQEDRSLYDESFGIENNDVRTLIEHLNNQTEIDLADEEFMQKLLEVKRKIFDLQQTTSSKSSKSIKIAKNQKPYITELNEAQTAFRVTNTVTFRIHFNLIENNILIRSIVLAPGESTPFINLGVSNVKYNLKFNYLNSPASDLDFEELSHTVVDYWLNALALAVGDHSKILGCINSVRTGLLDSFNLKELTTESDGNVLTAIGKALTTIRLAFWDNFNNAVECAEVGLKEKAKIFVAIVNAVISVNDLFWAFGEKLNYLYYDTVTEECFVLDNGIITDCNRKEQLIKLPEKLEFGQVEIGKSKSLNITIENNFDTAIALQGLQEGLGVFSITSQLPLGIGVEKEVEITFSPISNQNYSETAILVFSGANKDILLTGMGFEQEPEPEPEPEPEVNKPNLITDEISDVSFTSAKVSAKITDNGGGAIVEKGICYSLNQNPSIDGPHTSDGSGTQDFITTLNNLEQNTTYYVKAYATNSNHTGYGNLLSFTTDSNSNNNSIPDVSTISISNITETSASSGGNVTNDGGSNITSKGICWSTTSYPTTSNNSTNDGTGTNDFTSTISSLNANTEYFVRAYATNDEGTGYGEQQIFTTSISSGQPQLIYVENRIDDNSRGQSNGNDNNIIDAGETVQLDVRLQNIGNARANNVSAILQTNDSDVEIIENNVIFHHIDSGDFDWNNNDFLLEIDSNTPTKTVSFLLEISSDEGNWQQNFTVDIQGQSGESNSITPANSCDNAPILQLNTEYEVNIDVSDYGPSPSIDGQSNNGDNVRGFWIKFNEPSGFVGDIDIKITDASSNFDPVIGHKFSCGGIYYTQWNLSTLVANSNSYGENETFADHSEDNGYTHYIRIYHYYGNETPNISFKIKIEQQ